MRPGSLEDTVWDYMRLKNRRVEGQELHRITGIWRPMSNEWSKRFRIMKHLPSRGYLVVSKTEDVEFANDRKVPIQIHPFAVMEYYQDLILRAKDRIADLAIGVDVIVGFPGETYDDFLLTYFVMVSPKTL